MYGGKEGRRLGVLLRGGEHRPLRCMSRGRYLNAEENIQKRGKRGGILLRGAEVKSRGEEKTC